MYEGAEWLNGLLDVAWPVIDHQLFATAMDLIEDEMKAMTPGIVVGCLLAAVSSANGEHECARATFFG